MIAASIIIDTRRITKKGYPLKIRVHDFINSHRYIPLKVYQQEKSNKIIKTSFLIQREFELDKEIEFCNKNGFNLEQSLEVFKNGIPELNDLESKILILEIELNQLKQKRNTTSFKEFYDIYIKERIDDKKAIDVTIVGLGKFIKFIQSLGYTSESFKINDIDYELLKDYKSYCLNNNTSIHTFKSYLSHLRFFFKEAQKRKSLFIKSDNPFDNFVVNVNKNKVERSIDIKDFKEFINLKFENNNQGKRFQQVVDLLKFQFLIGGHDFIELSNLKWSDLKDNRIRFYRFKNKHRGGGVLVDNFLHPLALEIIEKYGDKSNERIFSFIPEKLLNNNSNVGYLTNVVTGRIKKILILYNCDFKVRTKYIRYTFRTIGGNLMINQMVLEKIMGHSNNSISMGYQGATPYEIQDAEHLKIIDAVFKK